MMDFVKSPEKRHVVTNDMLKINGKIKQDKGERNFNPERELYEIKKSYTFFSGPNRNSDGGEWAKESDSEAINNGDT